MDETFTCETDNRRIGTLPVAIAAHKHDLNVVQIYDRRDAEMPNVGLLKVKDAETGERIWVDTSMEQVRNDYARAWQRQQTMLENLFIRTGVNNIAIRTDDDYVKALMRLFR